MSKVEDKIKMLNILNRMYVILEDEMKNVLYDYRVVGKETEQKKHWKTGELLWEDEEKTIPRFDNIYDYVKKNPDEITDEDKSMITIIQTIEKHLDKLL